MQRCALRLRSSNGGWPMRLEVTSTKSAWRFPDAASGAVAFFIYGYPKNERANIRDDELRALRLLAGQLLGYSAQELARAVESGELSEVTDNGET